MDFRKTCCGSFTPMSPEEFNKAGVKLFGKRGWQTRMAERLGVDGSTVRRWVSGAVTIPNPAAAAVRCWLSVEKIS